MSTSFVLFVIAVLAAVGILMVLHQVSKVPRAIEEEGESSKLSDCECPLRGEPDFTEETLIGQCVATDKETGLDCSTQIHISDRPRVYMVNSDGGLIVLCYCPICKFPNIFKPSEGVIKKLYDQANENL